MDSTWLNHQNPQNYPGEKHPSTGGYVTRSLSATEPRYSKAREPHLKLVASHVGFVLFYWFFVFVQSKGRSISIGILYSDHVLFWMFCVHFDILEYIGHFVGFQFDASFLSTWSFQDQFSTEALVKVAAGSDQTEVKLNLLWCFFRHVSLPRFKNTISTSMQERVVWGLPKLSW